MNAELMSQVCESARACVVNEISPKELSVYRSGGSVIAEVSTRRADHDTHA